MRTFSLAVLLCGILSLVAQAQNHTGGRQCATTAYTQALQAQYPHLQQQAQEAKQAVQEQLWQQQGQWQNFRSVTVITIPVVFHVLYKSAAENISDAQLLSQLAVLNEDFRRMNEDAANTPSYFQPLAADTRIEFCLATIDPDGNPTSGITRTRTSRASFDYEEDNIKFTSRGGKNIWNRNHYLNIWVGNITDGTLGYATLPGTAPASVDGVVLHYATVGASPANPFRWAYNKGRTATHEVGHWLGLEHIWGYDEASCTDSDGISDTPNQDTYTTGCPTGIQLSCNNAPYGNMYQNYMDYSDDACMNLFTKGQSEYMNAVLHSTRATLLNSLACSGSIKAGFTTDPPADTLVVAGRSVQFKDASLGVRATSWLWEFEGGVPATSSVQNPTVSYPKPGRYGVKLTVSNGLVSDTEEKSELILVTVGALTVYPNPADDYLQIEQPARMLVREVELMNSVGKVVLKARTQTRVLRLDVRHLQPGMYYLRLSSTNGTEVRKIYILH